MKKGVKRLLDAILEEKIMFGNQTPEEFAKSNNWVKCKNGCCLMDPSVKDQTCMAEAEPTGVLPKGIES